MLTKERPLADKRALVERMAPLGGGVVLYHDPLVEAAWVRAGAQGPELVPGRLDDHPHRRRDIRLIVDHQDVRAAPHAGGRQGSCPALGESLVCAAYRLCHVAIGAGADPHLDRGDRSGA